MNARRRSIGSRKNGSVTTVTRRRRSSATVASEPALEQIRYSVRQIGRRAKEACGLLRINTSYVAYAPLIEPQLPAFLKRHPQIQLEVALDNVLSDITASGFDAGIRLGPALQRDMIGVAIGPPQRRVVVAHPAI